MSGSADPNVLKQEILKLEEDLELKKREFGQNDREALRQIIGEKLRPSQPPTHQSALPPQPPASDQSPIDLPSYLSGRLKDKVQELVNIAFGKSIGDAVKKARASGNAALIDAFHDALVDELYNYLIKQGKLKKL